MQDITVFCGRECGTNKGTWDQDDIYFQIDEIKRVVVDSGYNDRELFLIVDILTSHVK